jgi:Xaa-Pro aminopeptidase
MKQIHYTSGLPRAYDKTNLFYVYILVNSNDNNIFYVGKGKRSRCTAHIRNAIKGGKRGSYHVHNKIRKILDSGGEVKIKKIFFTDNQDVAYAEEMRIIQDIGLDNLTNITLGGNGSRGHPMTELNKEILRAIAKRPKSTEHKKKLSEYRKSHPPTEEMLEKLHASNRGRIHDVEWRRKQSEGLKGKKKSIEHCNKLKGPKSKEQVEKMRKAASKTTMCIETGEIFTNAIEAGTHYGVTPEAIRNAIRLGHKSASYHWRHL